MKNKKVGVVILTYNSSKTINECLMSLEKQTNKDFEVLIVDDDSKDNTLNMVDSLRSNLSYNISIYRNGAHNISRGRNIGIKNAKTKYVAFLDSDAYADKDWVDLIVKEFNKKSDLAVLGGKEEPIFTSYFSKGISINDNFTNKLAGNFWATKGCNFALNKSILKGVYFNENFKHNEESEFIQRAKKVGDFVFRENIKVNHEVRSKPLKYAKQMYSYGKWRVFLSTKSNNFRLVDYYPLVLILLTFINIPISLFSILILPVFSLLQSIIVVFSSNKGYSNIFQIFLAWVIKNTAWGFGTIVGFFKVILNLKEFRGVG